MNMKDPLFKDFFRDFFENFWDVGAAAAQVKRQTNMTYGPATGATGYPFFVTTTSVIRTINSISGDTIIQFDVPGCNVSDIDLSLDDQTLIVETKAEGRKNIHRYDLQDKYDLQDITARLVNGVLNVTVQKIEDRPHKKSRKIEIKT